MIKNSKNKSAAGMQHTPPRDIFNAKKIILEKKCLHPSLDLFMQSLKKIGKEMPKIVNNQFVTSIKGHYSCTYLLKFIRLQYQDSTFQY